MGFAGQVFAARVAIGLAVPSPQALQKAGGAISSFAAGLHNNLRRKSQRQALVSSAQTKAQLDKLNAGAYSSGRKLSNIMQVELEQSLRRLDTSQKKYLSKSFKNVLRDYHALQHKMRTPVGERVFQGVTRQMSGMDQMLKMGQNIQMLSRRHRQEMLHDQRQILKGQAKELENSRKKYLKLVEAHGLESKLVKKQEKKILYLHKQHELQKKNLHDLEMMVDEVEQLDEKYQDGLDGAEEWGGNIAGAADTIRNKFNEGLRNSVALLTAFTYKLNQNTQELIEFERELLNANSVFNLTNDELFKVGNTIIEFGNRYGIAVQNGATGLYQLASAGVTAAEALQILPHTLKLSMAVQGDHNTISKLTAQTLFGFGMEMHQAAEVTDKFAYAIQKSLIEYQDLSSAVKFALPFFTSTGQSIDQLLGALQVLTNRALEAGIAGRGLRQALAEFAESAMDAEAGFRKLGVEILNEQGEMLQLTEIASQFAEAVGTSINNTELLTTLIDELNVRGATAFIHLVQASDEFTEAVVATENAGGQLDDMVNIQNESLSAQIQILKNNVLSIFAMRDAAYEGTEFINAFHEAVVGLVAGLQDLLIEETANGQQLTEFGKEIQDLAVNGIKVLADLVGQLVDIMRELAASGVINREMIELMVLPLRVFLGIIQALPPDILKWIVYWKVINTIIPIGAIAWWGLARAIQGAMVATLGYNAASLATAGAGLGGGTGLFGAAGRVLGGGKAGTIAFRGGMAALGVGGLAVVGAAIAGGLLYKYIKKQEKKAAGGYLTPMAAGGSPIGGTPYLVGEQGPELFMPSMGGQLLNNAQTRDAFGGGNVILRDVSIGVDSFGGLV